MTKKKGKFMPLKIRVLLALSDGSVLSTEQIHKKITEEQNFFTTVDQVKNQRCALISNWGYIEIRSKDRCGCCLKKLNLYAISQAGKIYLENQANVEYNGRKIA